jgi:hypothetical protein
MVQTKKWQTMPHILKKWLFFIKKTRIFAAPNFVFFWCDKEFRI